MDENNKNATAVPLLAVSGINLNEVLVWMQMAKRLYVDHPTEIRPALQGLLPEGFAIEVTESDAKVSEERLDGFIEALESVIHEVRVAKAQYELSQLDKDKLQ